MVLSENGPYAIIYLYTRRNFSNQSVMCSNKSVLREPEICTILGIGFWSARVKNPGSRYVFGQLGENPCLGTKLNENIWQHL